MEAPRRSRGIHGVAVDSMSDRARRCCFSLRRSRKTRSGMKWSSKPLLSSVSPEPNAALSLVEARFNTPRIPITSMIPPHNIYDSVEQLNVFSQNMRSIPKHCANAHWHRYPPPLYLRPAPPPRPLQLPAPRLRCRPIRRLSTTPLLEAVDASAWFYGGRTWRDDPTSDAILGLGRPPTSSQCDSASRMCQSAGGEGSWEE